MKIRFAIPILFLSACIMLSGLGLAHAQDGEEGATAQGRATRRPPRGKRGAAARRAAPAPAAGDAAESGPDIQEFRTGVEYRPASPRTRVTFNLEDADLPDLVRLISNMTGKRFILPGKVRAIKATVYAPTEVSASEAYNAFLSILEVNGMTVVPAGRYLKIMETGGIEGQPITTYGPDSRTPSTDRFVTRLHRLDNIAAEDAANLLTRFKSRDGSITAYAPTNMLVITDTGTQIRRMLRILNSIDVSQSGEQVWIEPIHYANASDLAARLSEIFSSAGTTPSSGTTAAPARPNRPAKAGATAAARRRQAAQAAQAAQSSAASGPSTIGGGGARITNILADERTNSLIILASESAYLRILEMVRQLDIPLEGEGRIHVHYVQNGNADEIADTLNSLIGGSTTTRGAVAGQRSRGATGQLQAGRRTQTTAVGPSDLFEGSIRVTSYAPTNALVITSSLHDYAALQRVIERLDAPRRQVFIEAVIMELAVSRSNDLGISFHGGAGDTPVDGALSVLGFNAGSSLAGIANPESLTGLALGVQGPAIENSQQLVGLSIPAFGVVINALAQSGDANVLSTPHVMAMDNVQAEITVGQNIPLQTSGIPAGAISSLSGLASAAGQSATTAAALGGLTSSSLTGAGGIPRQDVGTTLRFTPHINENDEIRLEIEEEISEAGATEGTLGVVSINQRMAKTEVMVRDQQTIVIGGLMRESLRTAEQKVPVLGDIPLIGALFRRTEREMVKTNLLLFLTPYIIRDPSDLRAIFERKMRERQEFLDRYFVFGDHDYAPPVDYSRTRGLVLEIINELVERDAELALLEAARAAPVPEHHPRSPVGTYVPAEEGGDIIIEPEGEESPSADPASADAAPAVAVPEASEEE